MNYLDLPNIIITKTFSYLEERDLDRLSRVCKRFHFLVNDNDLWMPFLIQKNQLCASQPAESLNAKREVFKLFIRYNLSIINYYNRNKETVNEIVLNVFEQKQILDDYVIKALLRSPEDRSLINKIFPRVRSAIPVAVETIANLDKNSLQKWQDESNREDVTLKLGALKTNVLIYAFLHSPAFIPHLLETGAKASLFFLNAAILVKLPYAKKFLADGVLPNFVTLRIAVVMGADEETISTISNSLMKQGISEADVQAAITRYLKQDPTKYKWPNEIRFTVSV